MIRSLFIFFLGLMVFQNAKAQFASTLDAILPKQDTMLFYMKNSGVFVDNKDSADYFLFIMPQDTATHLYAINEYYPNGKPKLIAYSSTKDYRSLKFEGSNIEYYSNGHRKAIGTYKNGKPDGTFVEYFKNGQLYNELQYENAKMKLIECRDSTGKVFAENGTGHWFFLDYDLKNITIQGNVKDSLKEGEWDGMDEGRLACVTIYQHGALVSGTYYSRSGKKIQYHDEEVPPKYADGGDAGFNADLGKAVRYNGRLQGKVIATFVVEKDGSLVDIKIVRSPSDDMSAEIVKVIKASPPWNPGIQNGRPVRVQYTISFAFSLADSN